MVWPEKLHPCFGASLRGPAYLISVYHFFSNGLFLVLLLVLLANEAINYYIHYGELPDIGFDDLDDSLKIGKVSVGEEFTGIPAISIYALIWTILFACSGLLCQGIEQENWKKITPWLIVQFLYIISAIALSIVYCFFATEIFITFAIGVTFLIGINIYFLWVMFALRKEIKNDQKEASNKPQADV